MLFCLSLMLLVSLMIVIAAPRSRRRPRELWEVRRDIRRVRQGEFYE